MIIRIREKKYKFRTFVIKVFHSENRYNSNRNLIIGVQVKENKMFIHSVCLSFYNIGRPSVDRRELIGTRMESSLGQRQTTVFSHLLEIYNHVKWK